MNFETILEDINNNNIIVLVILFVFIFQLILCSSLINRYTFIVLILLNLISSIIMYKFIINNYIIIIDDNIFVFLIIFFITLIYILNIIRIKNKKLFYFIIKLNLVLIFIFLVLFILILKIISKDNPKTEIFNFYNFIKINQNIPYINLVAYAKIYCTNNNLNLHGSEIEKVCHDQKVYEIIIENLNKLSIEKENYNFFYKIHMYAKENFLNLIDLQTNKGLYILIGSGIIIFTGILTIVLIKQNNIEEILKFFTNAEIEQRNLSRVLIETQTIENQTILSNINLNLQNMQERLTDVEEIIKLQDASLQFLTHMIRLLTITNSDFNLNSKFQVLHNINLFYRNLGPQTYQLMQDNSAYIMPILDLF